MILQLDVAVSGAFSTLGFFLGCKKFKMVAWDAREAAATLLGDLAFSMAGAEGASSWATLIFLAVVGSDDTEDDSLLFLFLLEDFGGSLVGAVSSQASLLFLFFVLDFGGVLVVALSSKAGSFFAYKRAR